MDPLWTQSYEQLVATKKRIMESKIMRTWRSYGRPLWALAIGAADIAISENKTAAMMGVGAGFLGTLAVRSRTGILAYGIPTVAYGIGRAVGHFLSAKPDPHESPITKQLTTNVPVVTIPGKDDNYNTISGLSEQGMAAASRPAYGFGSGWRGQGAKNQETENKLTFGRVMSYINSALLIGAAGLTGYDRFRIPGAIAGAAIGAGIVFGTEALKPDMAGEKSLGKTLWSGALEGFKLSAFGSMMASSFMRGAFLERVLGRRILGKAAAKQGLTADQFLIKRGAEFGLGAEESLAGGIYGTMSRGMRKGIESIIPGRKGKIIGLGMETQFGSPTMFDLMAKHGVIQKIPAKEFLVANIKDIFLGTAAGIVASAPFSLIAHPFKRNKPVNPIKAHDAGRWGREWTTRTVGSDFEPGASFVGWVGRIFQSAGRGISRFPGIVHRTLRTGKVLAFELGRETRSFIKREFIPGLKKGRLPELGLAAAVVAEPALGVLGVMAPTALSMTAFAVLGKGGYMAIKRGKYLIKSAKFMRRYPTISKAVVHHIGGGTMRQIGSYIRHGTKNPAALFIELGGGQLGREAVKGEFILAAKVAMGKPTESFRVLSNIAPNIIAGLSKGELARFSREVLGVPFHSPWSGLFSFLRHPVIGFKAWRFSRQAARGMETVLSLGAPVVQQAASSIVFQKQLTKGAGLYENLVRSVLEGTEYAKATIKTGVEMRGPLQQAGAIHLVAKTKGKPAVSMYREFTPAEIYLGRIEIAPGIRGQGIGSILRKGEASVFKQIGFSPKTLVKADVVNERTAYLHLKTYGGEAVPYASQITLEEELYKVGNLPEVYAKNPERFRAAILRKEYNESKYIGARATGTLGYLEQRAGDSRKIGAMIDETLLEISANNIKRNRKLKQNLLHGEAIKAPSVLNAQRRQSHGVVRPPRKRLM